MKKAWLCLTFISMILLLSACTPKSNKDFLRSGSNNGEMNTQAETDDSAQSTATENTKAEGVMSETPAESQEIVAKPLDLTGLWVQKGKSETETHMVATIREDGKIGVFFIVENDSEPWTYWVGTYVAPTDDSKEYSWTSESTYGGTGFLASSDSTKEFKYKGEKITYPVTIDGETTTVELVRGEWDTSPIPESAFGSVNSATTEVKDIEIKESEWYVDGDYLHYYVVLHNPNEEIAVEFPSFRITARGAHGIVLDTEDQTLSVIYPGQDFYYGSQAFSVSELPTTVDFEALPIEDRNLKNASTLDEFKQLEVNNTAEREDAIVGEITNPNKSDFGTVIVVAVGRDSNGKVVYTGSTFVDNVAADATVPFSISNYSDTEMSSVEYYANQWE